MINPPMAAGSATFTSQTPKEARSTGPAGLPNGVSSATATEPRTPSSVSAADLLSVSATPGTVTEEGLRSNISVGIQYVQAWLGGLGAVAIFGLMEDAATAEISRSQVWQWLHGGITLADTGEQVTRELVDRVIEERKVAAKPVTVDTYGACMDALAAGRLDAVSTDDLILAALERADEVLLTSTTRDVQPLRMLDGRMLPGVDGPVAREAMAAFADLVSRTLDP